MQTTLIILALFSFNSCNKVRNINFQEREKRFQRNPLFDKAKDGFDQFDNVFQYRGSNYWGVRISFLTSTSGFEGFSFINKDLSTTFIKVDPFGNSEAPSIIGSVQCIDTECYEQEGHIDLGHFNTIKLSEQKKNLNLYSRKERSYFEIEIFDEDNKLREKISDISWMIFSYDLEDQEHLSNSYFTSNKNLNHWLNLSFKNTFMIDSIHSGTQVKFNLNDIGIEGIIFENLPYLSFSTINIDACPLESDIETTKWCGSFVTFDLLTQSNKEFKLVFSRKNRE